MPGSALPTSSVLSTYGTTHTARSCGNACTISRRRGRQSICFPAYQYPSAATSTVGAI